MMKKIKIRRLKLLDIIECFVEGERLMDIVFDLLLKPIIIDEFYKVCLNFIMLNSIHKRSFFILMFC